MSQVGKEAVQTRGGRREGRGIFEEGVQAAVFYGMGGCLEVGESPQVASVLFRGMSAFALQLSSIRCLLGLPAFVPADLVRLAQGTGTALPHIAFPHRELLYERLSTSRAWVMSLLLTGRTWDRSTVAMAAVSPSSVENSTSNASPLAWTCTTVPTSPAFSPSFGRSLVSTMRSCSFIMVIHLSTRKAT